MYILIDDDKTIHENHIIFSPNVFIDINEKYGARFREPISAIDTSGNLIFNICWESEYYTLRNRTKSYLTKNYAYYCNFFGENLFEEIDLLDFTFLEKYDVFYFEEINEYSWHIIRLINKCFGNKRVCSCDSRIKAFEDIAVEASGQASVAADDHIGGPAGAMGRHIGQFRLRGHAHDIPDHVVQHLKIGP